MSYSDAASLVLMLLGFVVALMGVVILRAPMVGVSVMLELWTGAGLIRLSAGGSWTAIAVAALVIVMRRIVMSQLVSAATSSSSSGPVAAVSPETHRRWPA